MKGNLLALLAIALLLSACADIQRAVYTSAPSQPPPTHSAAEGAHALLPSASVPTSQATETSAPPTRTMQPEPRNSSGPEAGILTRADTPVPMRTEELPESLRITIVYDNTAFDPGLTPAWGFAALLEYGEHTILFDTGGDGHILLGNMEELGLDPHEIEIVVVSHAHGDHTEGLASILDTGARPTVYLPASFPGSFKRSVQYRTRVVEVRDPIEIVTGVHSTGELRSAVNEQGLVVETPAGLVVITGCAHPGIARMVRQAHDIAEGDIALVIGGFHLADANASDLANIITNFRSLGVRQVAPTHCTGNAAIAMFVDEYGDDYVQGGAGRIVFMGSDAAQGVSLTEEAWPTEGWPTSAPEEQGMDADLLAEMLETIQEEGHAIDSVTVTRHGYLVADAAVYPFETDTVHAIHSCTKSVVSALVGIAIEQGYIEGVNQPVLDLLPRKALANVDDGWEGLTLEHLLTMSTGLACRDSYLYRWAGLNEMRQSEDWVQFMLDLPLDQPPGTHFEYCNGASFLLSAILQEATGTSTSAYAAEHLFGPLGITDVHWPSNPQGITIGWGDLSMKPHDMAKFGYLYLRGGLWNGDQIVPSSWIATSTTEKLPGTLQDGYGYQWWVDDAGYYMALGYAGQFIFVLPELDMVAVFSSDLDEQDFYVPQQLLADYVIPAARSAVALPENPDGEARLEASIKALARP